MSKKTTKSAPAEETTEAQAPVNSLFDEAVKGSTKNAMSAAGAGKGDLWMVPYGNLRVAPGFNVRDTGSEDYKAKVQWLKGQIQQVGFLRECPLTGYVVKGEEGEDLIYITAGHRRYEAVGLAIAEGTPIEKLPVVIQADGTSPEEMTIKLVTENNGDPLKPYEVALVCQRLQGYGMAEKDIAARLGYTVPYIKQLFELLSAPKAVRDMVTSGKVSASLAVKTVKKHGKEAAGKLREAAKAAESSGKKKVTAKHVEPSAKSKADEKIAGMVALIKELTEYVKTVRVGNDGQEMIDRAEAVIAAEDEL